MTMDAPIAALREKLAEAEANVADLTTKHRDLLDDAKRAQFAIDSAARERDSYASAVAVLESQGTEAGEVG